MLTGECEVVSVVVLAGNGVDAHIKVRRMSERVFVCL